MDIVPYLPGLSQIAPLVPGIGQPGWEAWGAIAPIAPGIDAAAGGLSEVMTTLGASDAVELFGILKDVAGAFGVTSNDVLQVLQGGGKFIMDGGLLGPSASDIVDYARSLVGKPKGNADPGAMGADMLDDDGAGGDIVLPTSGAGGIVARPPVLSNSTRCAQAPDCYAKCQQADHAKYDQCKAMNAAHVRKMKGMGCPTSCSTKRIAKTCYARRSSSNKMRKKPCGCHH